MKTLNIEEVIKAHSTLISKTGGSDGIRDMGLLESSVLTCYQTFCGEDLYPTIVDKASRLAFSLCHNHPFVDGNKRIAVLSLMLLLNLNGLKLVATKQELIQLGLNMANGTLSYEDVNFWVKQHIQI
jgi:death-on-curing protein